MQLACSARVLSDSSVYMSDCATCVVRNRAICSDLDAEELTILSGMGRHTKIVPGQSLIWEGEDALIVANVVDGILKLWSSLPDGREQIIGIAYPSDFIGRPFSLRTQYNVTALTDARVCMFHSSDFDQFAREHPRLEHKLLDRTLAELDRTRKWLVMLGRMNASEKLANFLLDMSARLMRADCSGDAPVNRFDLPFGRQQIADILGLTIETVSRQMTQLKQQGLIEIEGRRTVEIIDRQALQEIAVGDA